MSSSLPNNISISISDDDSDDPAGKFRVHFRRSHRKQNSRLRRHLLRRIFRISRRWWPVILFLPAIALLLFEALKLSAKTSSNNDNGVDMKSDSKPVKKKMDWRPHKEAPSNLDRLDPVTRVVGGIRQRRFYFITSHVL